jgi:hypothetical protein
MPTPGRASAIRIYRFKTGRASAPQGVSIETLDQAQLRHRAKEVWEREIAALEAKVVAPAFVVRTIVSPDLYAVSIQHPTSGVLRGTVISIEG